MGCSNWNIKSIRSQTSQGHHSRLAESAEERSICNLQQNLTVPKSHQTLHRAQGPRQGVRPPSPISRRTRIRRRIPQFFPGESVDCACGEDLQTREHILRTCTRYTSHRGSLQDENRKIALLELRGTPKGIASKTRAHSCSPERTSFPKTSLLLLNQTRVAQYTYRSIKSYFVCIAHLEKFLLGSTSTLPAVRMMVNLLRYQTHTRRTVLMQTHIA